MPLEFKYLKMEIIKEWVSQSPCLTFALWWDPEYSFLLARVCEDSHSIYRKHKVSGSHTSVIIQSFILGHWWRSLLNSIIAGVLITTTTTINPVVQDHAWAWTHFPEKHRCLVNDTGLCVKSAWNSFIKWINTTTSALQHHSTLTATHHPKPAFMSGEWHHGTTRSQCVLLWTLWTSFSLESHHEWNYLHREPVLAPFDAQTAKLCPNQPDMTCFAYCICSPFVSCVDLSVVFKGCWEMCISLSRVAHTLLWQCQHCVCHQLCLIFLITFSLSIALI